MSFDEKIEEQIVPILRDYDFIINEHYDNYYKLSSDFIEIRLAHNELDKSNILEVGLIGELSYVYTDEILKAVFGLNLKIDDTSVDTFLENVCQFVKIEIEFLTGKDNAKFMQIEEMVFKNSRIYTSNLLTKQNLKAADSAWENQEYIKFISLIDKIEANLLSGSYQLKYKIAKSKL